MLNKREVFLLLFNVTAIIPLWSVFLSSSWESALSQRLTTVNEVVLCFTALVKSNKGRHCFFSILRDKVTWEHPGDLKMLS